MTRNKLLEKYFKENYTNLIKSARKNVGNYSLPNAEDAVQEAFVRACMYFRSYDRNEDLDKWFRKILRNCINRIRNEERNNGVVYRDTDDIYIHEEETDTIEEVEFHYKFVSERDQQILNMRFTHGFKTIEIATMLNMSHDVVRDVIRRFKIRVKR